jgi:hypothetical protein
MVGPHHFQNKEETMKKILILTVIGFASAIAAQAQEVSPVYLEAKTGKIVKGQFTLFNKQLAPMPVTVEVKQLQVNNGKWEFGPIQPGTMVELKDTSAAIAPKSNRTFDYKVRCEKDCMVIFLSGMITGKTKEGVLVKLWLPSSVYLCSDTKDCRVRTKKAAGLP